MATIQSMSSTASAKMCAGQVVTDLSSSIKELLENALDAHPKSIQIKLYDQGTTLIEVIDDGDGIMKADRPLLCAKHATSKLKSFDDLYTDDPSNSVTSFGFRGEALFSLSQLSDKISVITKTGDESVGQYLEYDKTSVLVPTATKSMARSRGTTIQIHNLFASLPVRRMDFVKRIKSQRVKLFKLLQSYAIMCTGVKFLVVDVKGKKQENKLTTGTSTKLQQTIGYVLGQKFVKGMTEFSCDLKPLIQQLQKKKKEEQNHTDAIELDGDYYVKGLVSLSPTDNSDSTAREMQFFAVNGRPVDMPKMSRLLTDVWRGFDNSGKRPACVLNLCLPNSFFDVNLAPDKREVYVSDEDAICETLLAAFTDVWSNSDGHFALNEVQTMSKKVDLREMELVGGVKKPGREKEQSSLLGIFAMGDKEVPKAKTKVREAPREKEKEAPTPGAVDQEFMNYPRVPAAAAATATTTAAAATKGRVTERETPKERASEKPRSAPERSKPEGAAVAAFHSVQRQFNATPQNDLDDFDAPPQPKKTAPILDEFLNFKKRTMPSHSQEEVVEKMPPPKRRAAAPVALAAPAAPAALPTPLSPVAPTPSTPVECSFSSFSSTAAVIKSSKRSLRDSKRRRDRLRQTQSWLLAQSQESDVDIDSPPPKKAKGGAKAVLPKAVLQKQDFGTMEVLGQFNLGFILARCKKQNLWILDQHGCDEKYNFERMIKTTKIHEQKLIAPLPLELSPSEEDCVLENMDVFEKNGFR